jgi:hypothetical protein
MNRIRVALFRERGTAEALRQELLQADIPAEVHHEPQVARLWFVSKSAAGVRLEIPAAYWERCTQLFKEWQTVPGILGEAIRCPECRSLRVDFPQFTQKSFLTNVAMGLMAEVGLVEKQYYCEECHYTWSKPPTHPPRPRRHGAPNYFVEDIDESGWNQRHNLSHSDGVISTKGKTR